MKIENVKSFVRHRYTLTLMGPKQQDHDGNSLLLHQLSLSLVHSLIYRKSINQKMILPRKSESHFQNGLFTCEQTSERECDNGFYVFTTYIYTHQCICVGLELTKFVDKFCRMIVLP